MSGPAPATMIAPRLLAVALAALLAACLDPVGVRCPDGTLCPDRTTCAVVGGDTYCASDDQLARCAGQADGTGCPIAGQDVGVCNDGVCVRAGCGDGFRSGSEQCDRDQLDGVASCRDLLFYGEGPVTCGPDCLYDTSACEALGRCGDRTINGPEQCDTDALGLPDGNGNGPDCRDAGYYNDAAIVCGPNCERNLGACRGRCGDGQKQPEEDCDGTDFGGEACTTRGFYTGTLACSADCQTISTAACSGTCGDGVVNGPERCDGAAIPPGFDCALFGFYRGTLGCAPDCSALVTTSCAGYCGDGVLDAGTAERCDGLTFPGTDATCATGGASGFGPLGCDVQCQPTFDRCQAGVWVEQPGLSVPGEASDVWAAGNEDVWFTIPAGAMTRVRRRVEHAWVALPDIPHSIAAIWSAPGLVLAGGSGGKLLRLVRAPAPPHALSWQEVAAPTTAAETITDIWGRRADDYYLVTSAGRIIHATTIGFTVEVSNGLAFRAVHGDDSGYVIAAGVGVIAFRNPGGWVWITQPGLTFDAVHVRSPLDAWMVGHDGANHEVHLHSDGVVLYDEPLSPPFGWGPLTGVVAGAADDAWLAGGNGPSQLGNGGLLLDYDGATLTVDPQSDLAWVSAMTGVDPGDLWAATYQPFTQVTSARHFDGRGWRRRDVAALLPEAVIDVVTTGASTWLASATKVVRVDDVRSTRDPDVITEIAPPPGGYGAPIAAIWADADELFVFAGTTAWRRAGAGWTSSILASAVRDAWGTADQVFAVGGNRVHRYAAGAWTSEVRGADLRAISGTALDDVWFAGQGFHHRTGPGTFVDLPAPPLPLDVRAIFAASPSYVVFAGAGGGVGSIETWSGSQWLLDSPQSAPIEYTALAGSSPTDVWALGDAGALGYAAHWDGSIWTPIALPPSTPAIRAASAAGPRSVWAGADGGASLHLDHQLAALTGGDCPAATPVACFGGVQVPYRGAVVDRPVHYVLDAAFAGTITLELTSAGAPMELRVLARGADGTCDRIDPIATTPDAVQVPVAFGRRYYLEVRPMTTGQRGGFEISLDCRKS